MNISKNANGVSGPERFPEYDHHRKIVLLDNPATGLKGFIAIHRKSNQAPSFGATRLWRYDNTALALRDALRLSRLMSYKAALAGLPCGGAKGVIFSPERLTDEDRKCLLRSYAEEINNLHGEFITGTDVGLSQSDLRTMKEASPFLVGFNGGVEAFTAMGIYSAMQAAAEFASGSATLADKSFAIQGLGKVGSALLTLVYPQARTIYVADVNDEILRKIKKKYPNVAIVNPADIHKQKVDIFAPCAMGLAINHGNLSELNCRLVVGGANNQLEDDSVGDLLWKLGILYAPDYVANAGGLIAVYDEYEHPKKKSNARIRSKVLAIKERLRGIFERSKEENRAPNRIANDLAEKVFNDYQKS